MARNGGHGGGGAEHKKADLDWLWRHPALKAYLDRIGASLAHFRRARVEVEGERYRRTVARITWSERGEIDAPEEYAPNEKEAVAIAAEFEKETFPTSAPVASLELAPFRHADPDDLFEFRDVTGKTILFVHERVINEQGRKNYIPWTFWSDRVWRQMEPDDRMPLWGLDQLKDAGVVFLHEGAKAARHVRRMVEGKTNADREALAAHPWGEDLKLAAHLGWPGGADAAYRVDWKPIRKLSPDTAIVLVCDNDRPGVAAATEISRLLMRPMKAIVFDQRFKPSFDLGDEFPVEDCRPDFEKPRRPRRPWWEEKDGEKIYVGPRYDDYLRGATWATKLLPPKGPGKPAHVLRSQFAAEWSFIVDPPGFVHRDAPHRVLTEEKFNLAVRPFSDVKNTAALLAVHVASLVDGRTYDPSHPSGVVTVEGARLWNTHRPTRIVAIKGDPARWIAFLEHLIPDDDDRRELMRWIATLIVHPEIRMKYGVLLMTKVQGVGKGTLAERVLAPLVGWANVSVPSEQTVTDSSFNAWIANRRLAIVHEIYAGQSKKAYNILKSAITDTVLTVNEKFQPHYELTNWVHIIACSNSKRALKLAKGDRRWFVPGVREKKQPKEYWLAFNEWLSADGLGIIRQWAEDWLAEDPARVVGLSEDPPTSDTKEELIEAGRTEAERLIRDLAEAVIEDAKEKQVEHVLVLDDVRTWLSIQFPKRDDRFLESHDTIKDILVDAGLHEHPTRKRFKIGGRQRRVVASFPLAEDVTWEALKEHRVAPGDLLNSDM